MVGREFMVGVAFVGEDQPAAMDHVKSSLTKAGVSVTIIKLRPIKRQRISPSDGRPFPKRYLAPLVF